MKTATIIIRPIAEKFTNTRFLAAYTTPDGKVRCWMRDDTIKEFSPNEKLPALKEIIFSNLKGNHVISYAVPESPEEKKTFEETSFEEKYRKIYTNFLCNHPACLINGEHHPRTSNYPQFDVVDVGKDMKDKHDAFMTKLDAINMVVNMTQGQREDVMYFYGRSPVGEDKTKVLFTLADFNDGLCVNDANNFIKTWSNATEDMKFTINLRRAIDTDIIAKKIQDNQTQYYVGENFAGIDFSGVMDFMKKHPKIYEEHVCRLLNVLPPAEGKLATGDEKPKEWTKEEIDALRAEAKEFVNEGLIDRSVKYGIIRWEKLLPYVEQARKLKGK